MVGGDELKPLVACAERKQQHALALLQTCRQIHAEAYTCPYADNTYEGRHNGHLKAWADSLPQAQRAAVTSIRLTQRCWIISTKEGVEFTPLFWTNSVATACLGLEGLKRVDVSILLNPWTCPVDEKGLVAAKQQMARQLRTLLEEEHLDIDMCIHWSHGGSYLEV